MMTTARKIDANGFMSVDRNPISRVGVFPYLGSQIGAPDPNKIYMVYRPREELSSKATIDSFKNIPIIDDHTMLGPAKSGYTPPEKVGTHGVLAGVDFADDVLYGDLKFFSESLQNRINGGKKDLSLGYRCRYEKSSGTFDGQGYEYVQRDMRGNHLALVHRARCAVAVQDSQDSYALDSFDLDLKGMTMTEDEKKAAEIKAAADKAAADKIAADQAASKAALDAAVAGLTKVGERLNALDAKITALATKPAADASDDEKKAAAEKLAKEESDKKEADGKKAMDDKIAALDSKIEEFKNGSMKATMKELTDRDALYKKVSEHTGAFAHDEMTTNEVAAYAIDKLKLKVEKGHERAALDGFLHNRPAPRAAATYIAGQQLKTGSKLSNYISGKKE